MQKNKGGQKKAFTEKQIKLLKQILIGKNNLRNLLLLFIQLDTSMRSSDLLKLKVSDFKNSADEIERQFIIQQIKTKKTNRYEIQEDTLEYLKQYLNKYKKKDEDFLFTGRKNTGRPLSHSHHTRIIKKFAEYLGLNKNHYSTHSLRRTKPTIIYKMTHDVVVCANLLGHSDIKSTVHYLSIDKEKALEVARKYQL